MNFKLAKELEDLKEELRTLDSQLSQKIKEKLINSVRKSFKDFETFFNNQGFEVKRSGNSIFAKYKNLSVELKHQDFDTSYMGTLFRFEMFFQLTDKSNYLILLNPIDNYLGYQGIHKLCTQDDKLKRDIEITHFSIESTTKRLNDFETEIWDYQLRSDNNKDLNGKHFSSIHELLSTLLKTPE